MHYLISLKNLPYCLIISEKCSKINMYLQILTERIFYMNWSEVNIFTTTEGIVPVCGCLLGIGVTGFVIKDAKDFEEFLADKTGNWDYIDDDLMNLRNCETCVTVYLPDDSQGADMLSALRSEIHRRAAPSCSGSPWD